MSVPQREHMRLRFKSVESQAVALNHQSRFLRLRGGSWGTVSAAGLLRSLTAVQTWPDDSEPPDTASQAWGLRQTNHTHAGWENPEHTHTFVQTRLDKHACTCMHTHVLATSSPSLFLSLWISGSAFAYINAQKCLCICRFHIVHFMLIQFWW